MTPNVDLSENKPAAQSIVIPPAFRAHAQPVPPVARRLSWAAIAFLASFALAFCGIVATYMPVAIDWRDTYRPAALAVLSGQSPFVIDIYFAAPWALLPLIPLALLPENVGGALLFVTGLASFGFVAYRLGAKPVALAAFLLSPPVLHCLLNGNIEWIALLGFVLPPRWGLLLLAIKPQIGLGVALFWTVEALRRGGVKESARLLLPVSLALAASFVLFGLWPLRFRETLELTRSYNASLWPSTIPVGLALLAGAARKRDIRLAMGAGPCLSPYVLLHAWSGALVSLAANTAEMVSAVVGLWILVVLRVG